MQEKAEKTNLLLSFLGYFKKKLGLNFVFFRFLQINNSQKYDPLWVNAFKGAGYIRSGRISPVFVKTWIRAKQKKAQ